mmetsp:Transcript_5513/g.24768  ORF Transcript_5513/g.24768 Transcript_5513/m.24768 type:complete len:160 (-) Transcript_5513:2139-2618(-)
MASGGRHRVFGVISPSGSPDRDDQTKLNKSDLQSRPPFSSFILILVFFFIRLNLPHRFRNRRATKFTEEQRVKQKELLEEAGLERYAIAGKETDWDDALVGKKVPKSGMLSVKRKHGDGADASTPEKKSSKKDKKGDKGHKMKGAKTPKSSSKKSKHKA